MNTFPSYDDDFKAMVALFDRAHTRFLGEQIDLISSRVSERTLCGQLMLYIYEEMKQDYRLAKYYVDVEYNRNFYRSKEIRNSLGKNVRITCDLIVHSRGNVLSQDNLIAIEMKKVPPMISSNIEDDRERLMALTRPSYDQEWTFNGMDLPEFVCRFILGVFILIDYRNQTVLAQYYCRGELVNERCDSIII